MDVPDWMAMVQETDNLCDSKLLTNLCCNSTSDISYLKRLGLAKDIPEEGSIIETSQTIRLRLPDLHNDTLTTSKEARIWLNMYERILHLSRGNLKIITIDTRITYLSIKNKNLSTENLFHLTNEIYSFK